MLYCAVADQVDGAFLKVHQQLRSVDRITSTSAVMGARIEKRIRTLENETSRNLPDIEQRSVLPSPVESLQQEQKGAQHTFETGITLHVPISPRPLEPDAALSSSERMFSGKKSNTEA